MATSIEQELPVTTEMKFCTDCGQKILRRAEICPRCGCRQIAQPKGKSPYMGVGLATLGLVACVAIVGYSLVSWIIDALTTAVSEQGVAPVIKFLVICAVGARGAVRQIWGK